MKARQDRSQNPPTVFPVGEISRQYHESFITCPLNFVLTFAGVSSRHTLFTEDSKGFWQGTTFECDVSFARCGATKLRL